MRLVVRKEDGERVKEKAELKTVRLDFEIEKMKQDMEINSLTINIVLNRGLTRNRE